MIILKYFIKSGGRNIFCQKMIKNCCGEPFYNFWRIFLKNCWAKFRRQRQRTNDDKYDSMEVDDPEIGSENRFTAVSPTPRYSSDSRRELISTSNRPSIKLQSLESMGLSMDENMV